MKKLHHIFALIKSFQAGTKFLLGAMIIAATAFIYIAVAAPPDSPYNPGDTLAPTCSPGDTNCTIITPAVSGANSDITSLSGLTTPLSIGQGGTGSSSAGTAGRVLLDGVFSSNGLLRRTGANTYDVITDSSSNWTAAYGWGNHSDAGYFVKATDTLDNISDGVTYKRSHNDFTDILKTKLDGIEASANNYSLPTATDAILGGIKVGSKLTIATGVLNADTQSDNNLTNALKSKIDGIEDAATADQTGAEIVTAINVSSDLIDDNNLASTIARDSEITYKTESDLTTALNDDYLGISATATDTYKLQGITVSVLVVDPCIRKTTATYTGNLGGISGANEKCVAEFGEGWVFADCGQSTCSVIEGYAFSTDFASTLKIKKRENDSAICSGGKAWCAGHADYHCTNWTDGSYVIGGAYTGTNTCTYSQKAYCSASERILCYHP